MSAIVSGLCFGVQVPLVEWAVLIALADHADDQGENIYPGLERIAWKVGAKPRTVQRRIASLIEKGVLERVRRGRNGLTSQYRIRLDALDALRAPEPGKGVRSDTLDHNLSATPMDGALSATPMDGARTTREPKTFSPTERGEEVEGDIGRSAVAVWVDAGGIKTKGRLKQVGGIAKGLLAAGIPSDAILRAAAQAASERASPTAIEIIASRLADPPDTVEDAWARVCGVVTEGKPKRDLPERDQRAWSVAFGAVDGRFVDLTVGAKIAFARAWREIR